MSLNANEDSDREEDTGEFADVTSAYTDCGLDDSDAGVEMLMGGAETA